MDLKERQIFNYYKKIIESNNFTKMEIYGFLIFMRNYIYNKNLQYIKEFADLIAHRQRNQGLIQNAIKSALDDKYNVNGSNKIIGYNGLNKTEWENEWKKLAIDNKIKILPKTLKEITLCIFSLLQSAKYYLEDKNKKDNLGKQIGKVSLLFDSKNDSICLATTEGHNDSVYIVFALFDGYKINNNYNI
ncbi:MAG: hypothetical protein IKG14_00510 [Clostridia bacterium]|nr:hypothetical protein [Clostridia bacterium]